MFFIIVESIFLGFQSYFVVGMPKNKWSYWLNFVLVKNVLVFHYGQHIIIK
jgi:hypothetical protein